MKKNDYKKSFVRNTEQSLPKTVVTDKYENTNTTSALPPTTSTVTTAPNQESKKIQKAQFRSPKVHSSLGIVKQIAAVENVKPRKIKSLSQIDKQHKLAVDERLTRKVNFPYDQPIYKDLIPLCVKTQPPTVTVSREPLPLKDKEPNLSDFYSQKTLPEYSYHVSSLSNNRSVIRQFDGLRIYKTIRNWE